jgi:hypothetical protein
MRNEQLTAASIVVFEKEGGSVTACAEAGNRHQWRAFGELRKFCSDRPFFVDEMTEVNSKNTANCATV